MPDNPLGLDPQTAAMFQAPASSGPLDKVGNFLNHPAVQAALAGYLGTIGTPRYEGFGRAISHGGLGALGAYNQARQLQLQQPLLRAKQIEAMATTGKNIATSKELGQLGALREKQVGAYTPNPQEADMYASTAQSETDPGMRMLLLDLSNQARNGTSPAASRASTYMTARAKGAQVAMDQQKTELAKIQTQFAGPEAQAKIGAAQASQALSMGKIGEISGEEAKTAAQTEEARAHAHQIETGGTGPEHKEYDIKDPTKARYTHSATPDPGETFIAPATPTKGPDPGLTNLAKLHKEFESTMYPGQKYVTSTGEFEKFAILQKGFDPKTGNKLDPLQPGWSYTGEVTKDGSPIVHDPQGHPHKFVD